MTKLSSPRTQEIRAHQNKVIHLLGKVAGVDAKKIDLNRFETVDTLEEGLDALGLKLNHMIKMMEAAENKHTPSTQLSELVNAVIDCQIATFGDEANNLLNLRSRVDGNTLLHEAALHKYTNSYYALVDLGGEIEQVNNANQTPDELAAKHNLQRSLNAHLLS